jgi:hypothetical protein
MRKKKVAPQEQPTIWEIPDDVWPILQQRLDAYYPAKPKPEFAVYRHLRTRKPCMEGVSLQKRLQIHRYMHQGI